MYHTRLRRLLTRHALRRMAQRSISQDAIRLAIQRGLCIEQDGATLYFLGRRHLPSDLPPAVASRLEGTAVVVERDGSVLTVYRAERIPRHLRERRHRRDHHRTRVVRG
jgi:hypothetical protein